MRASERGRARRIVEIRLPCPRSTVGSIAGAERSALRLRATDRVHHRVRRGAMVTIEASETSSPACAAIRGKHTFALPVGTAYFGLGPNMGMPFNLVVEEAAGHEDH